MIKYNISLTIQIHSLCETYIKMWKVSERLVILVPRWVSFMKGKNIVCSDTTRILSFKLIDILALSMKLVFNVTILKWMWDRWYKKYWVEDCLCGCLWWERIRGLYDTVQYNVWSSQPATCGCWLRGGWKVAMLITCSSQAQFKFCSTEPIWILSTLAS